MDPLRVETFHQEGGILTDLSGPGRTLVGLPRQRMKETRVLDMLAAAELFTLTWSLTEGSG